MSYIFLFDSYIRQKAFVAWGIFRSQYSLFINGVKQGGDLSPIFFTIYIDKLLMFSTTGIGCYIGSAYTGVNVLNDPPSNVSPGHLDLKFKLPPHVQHSPLVSLITLHQHFFSKVFNQESFIVCIKYVFKEYFSRILSSYDQCLFIFLVLYSD